MLALLSRANALDGAGKFDEALVAARRALELANSLNNPVLGARARVQVGEAEDAAGDYETAEATLQEAYFQAAAAGAHAEAAAAATVLTYVVGSALARPDEGIVWSRHARVALDALDEPADGIRRTRLEDNLASAHFAAGRLEEAKTRPRSA